MHWKKKIRLECEHTGLKDNRLNYKCKECNKTSAKSVNSLIEKFPRTYKFSNGNLNKFVLLLRKGVYSYEYMDSWERFNETSFPSKKSFYSELNLEDINDKDYLHSEKVCIWNKKFRWISWFVCANWYIAACRWFWKFRDTCFEIYGLDYSYFLSATWISMASALEKSKCEFRIINRCWYVIEEWSRK